MSLADKVLAVNSDLPIRTDKPIHSGKVRSVYWLTETDSRRLIKEKGYDLAFDAPLAIMVISDRISAFDCIWHGEGDMNGVPGKGAALNAIQIMDHLEHRRFNIANKTEVDVNSAQTGS